MKFKFFSPLWGYEHEDFGDYCRRLAAAGFDGMELNLADDLAEAETQLELLEGNGLEYIAQHSGTRVADFEAHRTHYRTRMERIAAFHPQLINAHTGRDFFTFEQNMELIHIASEIGRRYDVPVIHETHRGRFSNLPSTTHRFLEADPNLRFAADFSHWCVATESYLNDHRKFVDATIERSEIIHARIGYEEGPQVNDPHTPEWAEALDIHLKWWDEIVAHHRTKGSDSVRITTEFGPPPYAPAFSSTPEPVSDQWELNLHMLDLLKKKYVPTHSIAG